MHPIHLFLYAIIAYGAFWVIWYAILIRPTRFYEFIVIPMMVLRHVFLFTLGGLIVLFLF